MMISPSIVSHLLSPAQAKRYQRLSKGIMAQLSKGRSAGGPTQFSAVNAATNDLRSQGSTQSIANSDGWQEVTVKRDPDRNGTSFKLDILRPADQGACNGVVLFLHGFEQYPNNYQTVLQRLADDGLWVIAPVQPRYLPPDPVLTYDGPESEAKLQTIVHADADQVARLLLQKGSDGRPALNTATSPPSDVPDISGKLCALVGHSLGGGMTWSIAAAHAEGFSKVAVMAPFPKLAGSFTPSQVIEAPGYQPPKDALVLKGDFDVLALGFQINSNILDPLRALMSSSIISDHSFPLGTHTGYQDDADFFGIDFPGGVLIVRPPSKPAAVGGTSLAAQRVAAAPKVKLLLGGVPGGSSQPAAFRVPEALETLLEPLFDNPIIFYGTLAAVLLLLSSVFNFLGDHTGGIFSLLFHLLAAVLFFVVPFEAFEIFYYGPYVQKPQTAERISNFMVGKDSQ